MRLIAIGIILFILYSFWKGNANFNEIKSKCLEWFKSNHFQTLEMQYTSKQILDMHRQMLMKDLNHTCLDPVLQFYPYLLLEVKYLNPSHKTQEGVILWDLVDGEMVINTQIWEKTHGFGDCIIAHADHEEFKIINALARKGGVLDREGLARILHLDGDLLNRWVSNCLRKQLIVQKGNTYKLHLQNPKLNVLPETKVDTFLVTKSSKETLKVNSHFSHSDIANITKAAFGSDFVIKRMTDVYLPVYRITVQNPDGSLHSTDWNAVNGKQIK